MEPEENEIFVDAGAYDGLTSLGFINWASKGYEAIKMFEPLKSQCNYINQLCKEQEIKNADVFENAVWNKRERLKFSHNGTASRINPKYGDWVECIDLDSKVEKATFVKMDVEGAELNAIRGAKNLIKRCKPKLAISVYHKPEDIITIPLEVISILSEYKLWLRHYSTNVYETVLYAIVNNK